MSLLLLRMVKGKLMPEPHTHDTHINSMYVIAFLHMNFNHVFNECDKVELRLAMLGCQIFLHASSSIFPVFISL